MEVLCHSFNHRTSGHHLSIRNTSQHRTIHSRCSHQRAAHKNEKAQTTAIWCISIALFLELLALLAGGVLFWIAGFILTVIGLVFLSMI